MGHGAATDHVPAGAGHRAPVCRDEGQPGRRRTVGGGRAAGVSVHHRVGHTAAIRRADEEGEQPLLPVLHEMAGVGSTDITPFLTIRPCVATIKRHLSRAVVDSGWERTVAVALDESPRVHSWVNNVRLDCTIPCDHQGRRLDFTPDFLVDLRDASGVPSGEHLVLEVKGLEREADRSKDVGAQRWMDAVNHRGKLGHWRYAKIHSPRDLISVLGDDPGPGAGE